MARAPTPWEGWETTEPLTASRLTQNGSDRKLHARREMIELGLEPPPIDREAWCPFCRGWKTLKPDGDLGGWCCPACTGWWSPTEAEVINQSVREI